MLLQQKKSVISWFKGLFYVYYYMLSISLYLNTEGLTALLFKIQLSAVFFFFHTSHHIINLDLFVYTF
jgi:hypothetical protein